MILFTPSDLAALQDSLYSAIKVERQSISATMTPEEIELRQGVIARNEALIARIDTTLKAVEKWNDIDAACWCTLIRDAAEEAFEATGRETSAFVEVMNRMDEEMMP